MGPINKKGDVKVLGTVTGPLLVKGKEEILYSLGCLAS